VRAPTTAVPRAMDPNPEAMAVPLMAVPMPLQRPLLPVVPVELVQSSVVLEPEPVLWSPEPMPSVWPRLDRAATALSRTSPTSR